MSLLSRPITIEQQITEFKLWREQLAQTLSDYRDWLDLNEETDSLQALRLFDLEESIKNDRLVLAFVAEFSRGKTETINALFFSDFSQRLLPSDPGRTTMCPSELFWNASEEPCIKLLPIETRKRDDSLAYLKSHQNEWVKLRLDMNSATSMKDALRALAQQKEVSLAEARALGLWDDTDPAMVQTLETKNKVEIPVWRHALINFPHPLLKSGLIVLDTPGLNALGTEPELTLSIIPNTHAVIFLLATDTGVTKSDMEIWTQYIRDRANCKIAVLNKIDMLWDELKSETEIQASIQSQIMATANQLNLTADNVIAISAQKALIAKIKKDVLLLERSGITRLEQLISKNVINAKYDILRNTIISETSSMVKNSRKNMQQRLTGARDQLMELQNVQYKGRDAIQAILTSVSNEKKILESSLNVFAHSHVHISKLGKQLLNHLDHQYVNALIQQHRQQLDNSWTTAGLNNGIKKFTQQTIDLAEKLTVFSKEIQSIAKEIYTRFNREHGYEARTPPQLEMDGFIKKMQALESLTTDFCLNPLNVMTEKNFLIRKFFLGLGRQIEETFNQAYQEAERWIQNLLKPLKLQIEDHKKRLENRMQTLMQVHENSNSLQTSITKMEQAFLALKNQAAYLDNMLLNLVKVAKFTT